MERARRPIRPFVSKRAPQVTDWGNDKNNPIASSLVPLVKAHAPRIPQVRGEQWERRLHDGTAPRSATWNEPSERRRGRRPNGGRRAARFAVGPPPQTADCGMGRVGRVRQQPTFPDLIRDPSHPIKHRIRKRDPTERLVNRRVPSYLRRYIPRSPR